MAGKQARWRKGLPSLSALMKEEYKKKRRIANNCLQYAVFLNDKLIILG